MQKWLINSGLVLAGLGAINWGLSVFDLNIVSKVSSPFDTAIYVVIAVGGVITLLQLKK